LSRNLPDCLFLRSYRIFFFGCFCGDFVAAKTPKRNIFRIGSKAAYTKFQEIGLPYDVRLYKYFYIINQSLRRRAAAAGICFVIALGSLLAMGGMTGAEQTIGQQWIAESVNGFGQVSFAAASIMRYHNIKASLR
jgi:hypothetical protein